MQSIMKLMQSKISILALAVKGGQFSIIIHWHKKNVFIWTNFEKISTEMLLPKFHGGGGMFTMQDRCKNVICIVYLHYTNAGIEGGVGN